MYQQCYTVTYFPISSLHSPFMLDISNIIGRAGFELFVGGGMDVAAPNHNPEATLRYLAVHLVCMCNSNWL